MSYRIILLGVLIHHVLCHAPPFQKRMRYDRKSILTEETLQLFTRTAHVQKWKIGNFYKKANSQNKFN